MLNDDNIDRELSADVEAATNKHLASKPCPLCSKPLTCEVTCWNVGNIYADSDVSFVVRAIHRGCIRGSYYVKHTIADLSGGEMTPEEFVELIARWTAEYLIEKLAEESEKK